MKLTTHGNTVIKATNSELEFTIEPGDVVFDIVETTQRSMGTARLHEARIDHEFLGNLIWHVWEYPVGTVDSTDIRAGGHDLIEVPFFSFSDVISWKQTEPGSADTTSDGVDLDERLVFQL